MLKKELIIFDFDGTIADTLYAGWRISSKLADHYGFKSINESDFDRYRDMPTKMALKELGVSLVKLPRIIMKMRKLLANEMDQLGTVKEMDKIIPILSQHFRMGIVTSNSETNASCFLNANKLSQYFDFVHSSSNLFGKSSVLGSVLKKQGITADSALYIGDETRDVDACHKVGIDVIAVTWGLNSRKALSEYNPQYIVDEPRAILDILNIQPTEA